jgi:transposase
LLKAKEIDREMDVWRAARFSHTKQRVKVMNPENTSRECPKCHYIDARNRKNQSLRCGYTEMADYVAAINIAARAAVKQPIVADSSSYKPTNFNRW